MTRETKVGLVVGGSFLCLVGVVVAARMFRDSPEPAGDQVAQAGGGQSGKSASSAEGSKTQAAGQTESGGTGAGQGGQASVVPANHVQADAAKQPRPLPNLTEEGKQGLIAAAPGGPPLINDPMPAIRPPENQEKPSFPGLTEPNPPGLPAVTPPSTVEDNLKAMAKLEGKRDPLTEAVMNPPPPTPRSAPPTVEKPATGPAPFPNTSITTKDSSPVAVAPSPAPLRPEAGTVAISPPARPEGSQSARPEPGPVTAAPTVPPPIQPASRPEMVAAQPSATGKPAGLEIRPEPTPATSGKPAVIEAKPEPTPATPGKPAVIEAKPEPTPATPGKPAVIEAKPEPTPAGRSLANSGQPKITDIPPSSSPQQPVAVSPLPAPPPGSAPPPVGNQSPTAMTMVNQQPKPPATIRLPIPAPESPGPASQPQPRPEAPLVRNYDMRTHNVQPGESSLADISKRYYQSDKYGRALLLFNRGFPMAGNNLQQEDPRLQPGQAIYIPPREILESSFPHALSQSSPAAPAPATQKSTPIAVRPPAPVTPAIPPPAQAMVKSSSTATPAWGAPDKSTRYRVRDNGEYLLEIARHTLGDSRRWTEIYRLNPSVRPEYPIPAGTELRIPVAN